MSITFPQKTHFFYSLVFPSAKEIWSTHINLECFINVLNRVTEFWGRYLTVNPMKTRKFKLRKFCFYYRRWINFLGRESWDQYGSMEGFIVTLLIMSLLPGMALVILVILHVVINWLCFSLVFINLLFLLFLRASKAICYFSRVDPSIHSLLHTSNPVYFFFSVNKIDFSFPFPAGGSLQPSIPATHSWDEAWRTSITPVITAIFSSPFLPKDHLFPLFLLSFPLL